MLTRPLLLVCLLGLLNACATSRLDRSQEGVSLTVIAIVPEGTGEVFMAGNLEELGLWDPGVFRMQGEGIERRATLRVPVGSDVEFKLTNGSWDTEALREDLSVPENRRVTVTEDTVIRVNVPVFKGLGLEMPYPDPTRYENDIAAFERQDRQDPPDDVALLAIGSSSIVHWHDTIQEDLAPVPVVPRGFGGSTMHDLLYFADRIVFPYEPKAILVYEGDNDVAGNVPVSQVAAEYKKFFERVRAELPETHVFVLPAKPSPSRWVYWPRMRELNVTLREMCEADLMMTYIDTATPLLRDDGTPDPDYYLDDELHLNSMGYEVWTSAVRPVVLEWWEDAND